MMMEVLFFEEANAEIEEGRAWYRRRSEAAEGALLGELNDAIEIVGEAPLRWQNTLQAHDGTSSFNYLLPFRAPFLGGRRHADAEPSRPGTRSSLPASRRR
jgi:hypothetical protein